MSTLFRPTPTHIHWNHTAVDHTPHAHWSSVCESNMRVFTYMTYTYTYRTYTYTYRTATSVAGLHLHSRTYTYIYRTYNYRTYTLIYKTYNNLH